MADVDAHTVWLGSETDVAGFRSAARRLLAHKIEPQRVVWQISGAAEGDLFASIPTPPTTIPAESAREHAPLRLPAAVVALFERAALHRDPQRHPLLYRWLWRLAHPDGHFKFPHLWPLKLPRAGRANYESAPRLSAMREAASLRR